MPLATLLKQPAEVLVRPMTFSGLAAISSLDGVTVAARGLVQDGAALIATPSLFAGALTLQLAGGADGERYLVTVRVHDAGGQQVESELEVVVLDAAWAMPDGGAPYLSIAAFVDRFGLDEVVRMTDPVGDGRIDRSYLVGALVDAQAIADAHIASRYAVPLAEVPPIIAMLIADLARARLYPRGAPEAVAEAAKAATRMLERIQSGAMQLPLAAGGAAAEQAASDAPILGWSGGRAYPDNLAGY